MWVLAVAVILMGEPKVLVADPPMPSKEVCEQVMAKLVPKLNQDLGKKHKGDRVVAAKCFAKDEKAA